MKLYNKYLNALKEVHDFQDIISKKEPTLSWSETIAIISAALFLSNIYADWDKEKAVSFVEDMLYDEKFRDMAVKLMASWEEIISRRAWKMLFMSEKTIENIIEKEWEDYFDNNYWIFAWKQMILVAHELLKNLSETDKILLRTTIKLIEKI